MYIHIYSYKKETENTPIVDISITTEPINYILAKYKTFIYFLSIKCNEHKNIEETEEFISWTLINNKLCECGFDIYERSQDCIVPSNVIMTIYQDSIIRNSMFGKIETSHIKESIFKNVYPLKNPENFKKLPDILYEYLRHNYPETEIIEYKNDPHIIIRHSSS